MNKGFLARLLFCEEDSLSNVLLHIPVGVISAFIACLVSGWLGLAIAYVFVKYERIEQKDLSDKCYPDIQGWLWGAILMAIGIFVWGVLANGV